MVLAHTDEQYNNLPNTRELILVINECLYQTDILRDLFDKGYVFISKLIELRVRRTFDCRIWPCWDANMAAVSLFCDTNFHSHFRIDHNAPCLPPKVLRNRCFQFLPGITVVPRESERQWLC